MINTSTTSGSRQTTAATTPRAAVAGARATTKAAAGQAVAQAADFFPRARAAAFIPSLRKDLQRLVSLAHSPHWTDDAPVPPTVITGPPTWRPRLPQPNDLAPLVDYSGLGFNLLTCELRINPGHATVEGVQALFQAPWDLNRSSWGSRIEIRLVSQ